MATISITTAHDLPRERARSLVEALARDLAVRYGVSWRWDGDDVRFERPGASGLLHVGEHAIVLNMKLGVLLSAATPAIEKAISERLAQLTGDTRSA